MSNESQVTARTVLDAVLEIKRLGPARALEQLEEDESELASFVMESLSDVHRRLLALRGRASASQAVYLDFQTLVLVCITACRAQVSPPDPDDPSRSD